MTSFKIFKSIDEMIKHDKEVFRRLSGGERLLTTRLTNPEHAFSEFASSLRQIASDIRETFSIANLLFEQQRTSSLRCRRMQSLRMIEKNLILPVNHKKTILPIPYLEEVYFTFHRFIFVKMTALELDYKLLLKYSFFGYDMAFPWSKVSTLIGEDDVLLVFKLMKQFGLLDDTPSITWRIEDLGGISEQSAMRMRHEALAEEFSFVPYPIIRNTETSSDNDSEDQSEDISGEFDDEDSDDENIVTSSDSDHDNDSEDQSEDISVEFYDDEESGDESSASESDHEDMTRKSAAEKNMIYFNHLLTAWTEEMKELFKSMYTVAHPLPFYSANGHLRFRILTVARELKKQGYGTYIHKAHHCFAQVGRWIRLVSNSEINLR